LQWVALALATAIHIQEKWVAQSVLINTQSTWKNKRWWRAQNKASSTKTKQVGSIALSAHLLLALVLSVDFCGSHKQC
jgi:hypothetical protein